MSPPVSTEDNVEAPVLGPERLFITQVPFADARGSISRGFDRLGNSYDFRIEICPVWYGYQLSQTRFSPLGSADGVYPVPRCVLARNQTGTGGSAVRRIGISAGKDNPVRGELIDVRRFVVGAAEAGEVFVAKVVDKNEHDVGSSYWRPALAAKDTAR